MYKLRIVTWEDVEQNTPLLDLRVIYEGSLKQIHQQAERYGFQWVSKPKELFKGFYKDSDGISYIIT